MDNEEDDDRNERMKEATIMWEKIKNLIQNKIEVIILIEILLIFNNLITGELFAAIIWLCLTILDISHSEKNEDIEEENDNDKE